MSHFATITPTRRGWLATFHQRHKESPDLLFPNGLEFTTDLVGLTRWSRTRKRIERKAARVIERLDADEQRKAERYDYTPRRGVR